MTVAVRTPVAPLARRSIPLARAAVASSSSAVVLSRSAVAAPVCVRGFAVTNAFERSANTSEFLDFATARKDLNKWRKQLLYRSRQRGKGGGIRTQHGSASIEECRAAHCSSVSLCVRAGWLELDLIMGTWADEHLANLDANALEQVRTTNK